MKQRIVNELFSRIGKQIFNNEQLVNIYKQAAKFVFQCNIQPQLVMVSRICSDTMLQSH